MIKSHLFVDMRTIIVFELPNADYFNLSMVKKFIFFATKTGLKGHRLVNILINTKNIVTRKV